MLRQRLAGLGEIDMPCKIRKLDRLSDISSFVEKGLAESCETEAKP